jgi:hypothetical protein
LIIEEFLSKMVPFEIDKIYLDVKAERTGASTSGPESPSDDSRGKIEDRRALIRQSHSL